METINIQLKHFTTEPDSTPHETTDSDNNRFPQESHYEVLHDASDNYFSNTTPTISSNTDNMPDIHQIKTFSCNNQKQPLLDEDLSNHTQSDQD